MIRLIRLAAATAAALVTATALSISAGVSAQAACVGPQIEVTPTEVAPGQTVTITGNSFGTDCHDGGQEPQDQESQDGILGAPATGIEVSLHEGNRSWLVARGDAEDDYSFTVRVAVPDTALPGTLHVRTSPESRPVGEPQLPETSGFALTVRATGAGPAPTESAVPVATFGPEPVEQRVSESRLRRIGTAAVVGGIILTAVVILVRRLARPTPH